MMDSPFKKIFVLLAVVAVAFCAEGDSLRPYSGDKPAPARAEAMEFKPMPSSTAGQASFLSSDRFTHQSRLSFGYSSNGRSGESVMSYTHGLNYVIRPKLQTFVAVDVSRYSSEGGTRTELTPAVRLEWRPSEGAHFRLDLRLAPQVISGNNLFVDPWHRPIGF